MRISQLFFLFAALAASVFISSCEKEDDPTTPGSSGEGRFSAYSSCTVITPPEGAELPGIYTKYLNCNGIPIISTFNVSSLALMRADSVVGFMLNGLPDLKNVLIENGTYMVLYDAEVEVKQGFPGFEDAPGSGDVGVYNSDLHAAVTPEAALLCQDPWIEDAVFVHEFAHAMHMSGFNYLYTGFDNELENLYNNALGSGLWRNTYAATNYREFWADAVQVWYNVQWPYGTPEGNGSDNNINRRNRLIDYDPNLYAFLDKYLNNDQRPPGCYYLEPDAGSNPNDSTVNPVSCPATITDIDGNVYDVVKIGNRCWTKQNLKVTRFKNNVSITEELNGQNWENSTNPLFASHTYSNTALDSFGRFYNWYALSSNNGLCPDGWHVANKADWDDLGSRINSVYELRVPNVWVNVPENGTDDLGFSWLPAGGVAGGVIGGAYGSSFFIVPDDVLSSGGVNARRTFSNHNHFQLAEVPKTQGSSCRCVKD